MASLPVIYHTPLAWADRTFADKNGGRTYPARFDNRHTINVLVNWNINSKVAQRVVDRTFGKPFHSAVPGVEGPPFDDSDRRVETEAPLRPLLITINCHSITGLTSRALSETRAVTGRSLYNAYNHLNVVGIKEVIKTRRIYPQRLRYSTHSSVFKK